jgi:hypothetical protein
MYKYLYLLICSAAILFLTGCETLEGLTWEEIWGTDDPTSKKDGDFGEYKPKFIMTFNEIVEYPRAEKIERKVKTMDGEDMWINIIPKLHSKNMKRIKAVPDPDNPGTYHLKAELDHTGNLSWMYVTGKYRGEKIAVLIDGVVYTTFVPRYISNEDETWITLPIPFDEVYAKRIEKYAEKNYKHFHPSIHRLF